MQIMATVNSRLELNADRVTMRTIEGKNHIIVSGAKHMIGDSVMNGGLYRAEDMQRLADELISTNARIPAPLEHPTANGEFISARDPLADINHGGGAFHFNFRVENNRLVSDTAIDPDKAMLTDRGRELLHRINEEQPVDMSTGFFLIRNKEEGTGRDGVNYNWVASNLDMDHSALLIENPGAKTSGEGVGLFANTRTGQRCDLVVNSLSDAAEYVPEVKDTKIGLLQRLFGGVNTNKSVYNGNDEEGIEHNSATNGDSVMSEELTQQVNALQQTVNDMQANIADAVAAAVAKQVQPLSEKVDAMTANAQAAEAAEKEGLVAKVVEANLLSKETAETMTVNQLRELAPKAEPQGDAFLLGGGQMQANGENDAWADYDLNANMETK